MKNTKAQIAHYLLELHKLWSSLPEDYGFTDELAAMLDDESMLTATQLPENVHAALAKAIERQRKKGM